MPTPRSEIVCYDGQTLSVDIRPLVQVEARRGRRWKWFGKRGWWIQLCLFHGWHTKKFVASLSEAGIFLKYDPDYLPWLEEEQHHTSPSDIASMSSNPPRWTNEAPI